MNNQVGDSFSFTSVKVFLFDFNFNECFSFSLSLFIVVSTDPCLSFQCNQGTCQKDRNNQPYCSCYEGYGGSRCETQIGM